MTDNTLIDIMLICKGWYNKELYKDKLSAMQAYYDKYYTYGESQVELTKDFVLHLFLEPLVSEAIKRTPNLIYYIFNRNRNNINCKDFTTEMYNRCLTLIANIKKDTFEFDEKYLDMFEKAKKCNYEDETIGII
jgi:hypothetical protein|nr:MAG TPA: hypothetical protein [Caudoviricetes sp.]